MGSQQVREKLNEMQIYVPLLDGLIQRLSGQRKWARSSKLNSFRELKTILVERNPFKVNLDELFTSERILQDLFPTALTGSSEQSSQSTSSQSENKKGSKIPMPDRTKNEIILLDDDEEEDKYRFHNADISKKNSKIEPEHEENRAPSSREESFPKYNEPYGNHRKNTRYNATKNCTSHQSRGYSEDRATSSRGESFLKYDEPYGSHRKNTHYNVSKKSTSHTYSQNGGYSEDSSYSDLNYMYSQNGFNPSLNKVPNNYYYQQSSLNDHIPRSTSEAAFKSEKSPFLCSSTYGYDPQLQNGPNLNYQIPLNFNNKYQCAYCIFGSETEIEMRTHLRQRHYSLAPNMYVQTQVENQGIINNGAPKPPIKELYEYCKERRLRYWYQLEPVTLTSNNKQIFQYRVKVGDTEALGPTKLSERGAKNAAARALLDMLIKNDQKNNEENSKTTNHIDLRTDNPIGVIQEVCMKLNWPIPTYDLISEEVFPREFSFVCILFKHEEVGSGKSMQLAKKNAAFKMLKKLQNSPLLTSPVAQWPSYEKREVIQSQSKEKSDDRIVTKNEADLQGEVIQNHSKEKSDDRIVTENEADLQDNFNNVKIENKVEESPFVKEEEVFLNSVKELLEENSYSNEFDPYIDPGIDSGFQENCAEYGLDGNPDEVEQENNFEQGNEELSSNITIKEENYYDDTEYGPSENDSNIPSEAKISDSADKTETEFKENLDTSDGSNNKKDSYQQDHFYKIIIKKEPKEESEEPNGKSEEPKEKSEEPKEKSEEPEEEEKNSFSTDRELSGANLFLCGLKNCDYIAETESDLKEHLLVCDFSRNSPTLTCPFCGIQIIRNGSYLKHLHLHGEKKYSCSLCDFTSGQEKGVVIHAKNKHKVIRTKTVRKKNAPKGYFVIVPQGGDNQLIKTDVTKTEETATTGNTVKKSKSAPKNKKMKYRCGICLTMEYETYQKASDHLLQVHHMKSKYACDLCHVKNNSVPFFSGHFAAKHKGEKISYKRFLLRLDSNGEVLVSDLSSSSVGKRSISNEEEEKEFESKRFKKNDLDMDADSSSTPTPNPPPPSPASSSSDFSSYVNEKRTIRLTKKGEDLIKNSLKVPQNMRRFVSLICDPCGENFEDLSELRKHHEKCSLRNIKAEIKSEND